MLADNQDLIYSNYFCEELHAAEGSKYTQIHTHSKLGHNNTKYTASLFKYSSIRRDLGRLNIFIT